MLVIIGTPDDVRTAAVISELLHRSEPFALFNTIDFPYHTRLSYDIERDQQGFLRTPDGSRTALSDIRAVYYCTQQGFQMLEDDPPELHGVIYNNINSAVWSFFHSLDCLIVNPVIPADLHDYKSLMLRKMRMDNIRVPDTLVSNDPEQVVAFYERQNGRVVCKPPWGQAFTERMTADHLKPEVLARLQNSPVMLQEYIPGQDLRAYVLGDEVFGVEIRSETLDLNMDDSARRVAIDVPPEMADIAIRATRTAGLIFSAVDIRRTPEGEYVVFEANSSPDFTTDEAWTGYPLSGRLVDFLLAGKKPANFQPFF